MPDRLTIPNHTHLSNLSRLRWAVSLESLSSVKALLPTILKPKSPIGHSPKVEVTNYRVCPDPLCGDKSPHVWEPLHPIQPPPPNFPQIDLGRFGARLYPFPNTVANIYCLLNPPPVPMINGQRVYTPLYGIVELYETDFISPVWSEFKLYDTWKGASTHVATLVVDRRWCTMVEETASPHGLLSRILCRF